MNDLDGDGLEALTGRLYPSATELATTTLSRRTTESMPDIIEEWILAGGPDTLSEYMERPDPADVPVYVPGQIVSMYQYRGFQALTHMGQETFDTMQAQQEYMQGLARRGLLAQKYHAIGGIGNSLSEIVRQITGSLTW